jgi:hypothetical protein
MIEIASHQVLTAMITPAVLISASGTLVLSTSNRLTRVVDRVRSLAKESQQHVSVSEEYAAFVGRQLATLTRRVSLLRTAMTVLYTAIALFIMTSMAIGILGAIHNASGWLPVLLALGGTGALLHASWLLVHEARLAVVSTLDEMAELKNSLNQAPASGEAV